MKKVLLFLSLLLSFTFATAQENVKLYKVTESNTKIIGDEWINNDLSDSTIGLYSNENLIVVYSDKQQILEYSNIIKNKNIDGSTIYNIFCVNRNSRNHDICLLQLYLYKDNEGTVTITYNDVIYKYNIVPLT